jgi:hypothetical protein
MRQKTTWQFSGVPMVRIQLRNRAYYVQQRSNDTGNDWQDVQEGSFASLDEAVDAAPELCHF